LTLGSTATRKLDMIMRVQVGRWNLRSFSSIRLDGHTLPCMLVCISCCKDTACTTGGAATLLQLLQTSSSSSPAVQPPCRFTQPCQPKVKSAVPCVGICSIVESFESSGGTSTRAVLETLSITSFEGALLLNNQ